MEMKLKTEEQVDTEIWLADSDNTELQLADSYNWALIGWWLQNQVLID